MKIVFVSNYFNHHQKPVADVLYRLTDGEYRFVETTEIPDFRKKLGYKEIAAPYTIKFFDNPDFAQNIIDNSEVVVLGACKDRRCIVDRLKRGMLTFEYSERLFKSPKNYLKIPIYIYNTLRMKGAYMLSASAYTANDNALLGAYKDKCYKWGYFPEVKLYNDINLLVEDKCRNVGGNLNSISILWVGRLIGWKHPESTIYLAKKLKESGICFQLNIIGHGNMELWLRKQILKHGLENYVHLLGSMSPENVRSNMEKADIFLFTSDRNEGWGAVLNESMNSACAVVASHAIGSVPFLIEDKNNGLIYKDQDWDDLSNKVAWLIENVEMRRNIQIKAYETISGLWSANHAAQNLLKLVEKLKKGESSTNLIGPCSKACILRNNWYK